MSVRNTSLESGLNCWNMQKSGTGQVEKKIKADSDMQQYLSNIFLTLLTCICWLAYAARGSELDRGAAHFGLLNYDTKHLFLDRLLSCCLDWESV